MTTPETRTVQSIDLPLGPGRRTLRATLTTDEDGEAQSLVLAVGFGGAGGPDPFLRPPWLGAPLVLPASVLPELREALEVLS